MRLNRLDLMGSRKAVSWTEWLFILVGLAIAVPLIFFHLGHLPLRVWDEARLAVNGYEMLQNHRFLVTYYEGAPDLWNTKPPLLIWLQVLSMKCFGVNEVAFRLPSAVAVLLTCILFYIFLRSYLKDFHAGFIQNMVLLTTTGLFTWHAAKNGDYDALLMLLCGAYCLAFFVFLEKDRAERLLGRNRRPIDSPRYLYLFYLCLSLAVLTKSSAALFFLPGLAVYALLTGQLVALLKNKHVYIGLLIPVVLVGGFYMAREAAEPGYLRAVWENEFGGRLLTVIEGHDEPVWFYLRNLYDTRFRIWSVMAFGGMLFGLASRERRLFRLTLFSTVLTFVYIVIISLARTKLFWYDIPLYPFLAVLTAVFIWRIFEILRSYAGAWMAYVFLFCMLTPAVCQIYRTGFIPRETTDWEIDTHVKTRYLRDLCRHPERMAPGRRYVVVDDAYHAQHLFYIYRLQADGHAVELLRRERILPGDLVLCDRVETAEYLDAVFETERLSKDRVLEIYNIKTFKTEK